MVTVANALLIDEHAFAPCARQDIQTRGHHRCAVASSGAEAWTLLRAAVRFDLVIVEARLASGRRLDFVRWLRGDCFFRATWVLVYANTYERMLGWWTVALKTRNCLLPPDHERLI